jgi:hypothetical protein
MRPINNTFDASYHVILVEQIALTSDTGLVPHIRFAFQGPSLQNAMYNSASNLKRMPIDPIPFLQTSTFHIARYFQSNTLQ